MTWTKDYYINEVLGDTPKGNINEIFQITMLRNENYAFEITTLNPRGQWVNRLATNHNNDWKNASRVICHGVLCLRQTMDKTMGFKEAEVSC